MPVPAMSEANKPPLYENNILCCVPYVVSHGNPVIGAIKVCSRTFVEHIHVLLADRM